MKGWIIRQKTALIIVAEIMTLVIVILGFAIQKFRGPEAMNMGLDMSAMQSPYGYYDNGWFFDSYMVEGIDEPSYVLYGPYISIPRGFYTLVIDYESEKDQEIEIYAEDGDDDEEENNPFIVANTVLLKASQKSVSYDFRIKAPINNLEVRLKYNGEGSVRLTQIALYKSHDFWKRTFVSLLVVFLFFDFCIFKWSFIYDNRLIIASIFAMTFLTSLPLLVIGIHRGHDLIFHLLRIESISDELRLGQFPVRLQSAWFDGMGYPVSIYYGDLMLYLPALLRIMGFDVMETYKAYVIFINFVTVLTSYYSFYKIIKDRRIAVAMTVGYVMATYRLVNIYIRAALGEYTAMVFYPLVALAVYLIYTDEEVTKKPDLRNSTMLALAMAGIILTHMLSAEMIAVLILIYCVIMLRKTIRMRTLLTFLLSVVQTVALTFFFMVPFVDYYLNVDVKATHIINGTVHKIQQEGAYVLQLFSFYQNPFGHAWGAPAHRMSLTTGMPLMLALVAALIVCIIGIADKTTKVVTTFALIVLWMTTDIFPWNGLAFSSKLGNAMSSIQFPWRYIAAECVILSILAGFLMSQFNRAVMRLQNYVVMFFVGLSLIGMFVFCGQYIDSMEDVNYISTNDIYRYSADSGDDQYLRIDSDGEVVNFVSTEGVVENVEAEVVSRTGSTMEVACTTGQDPGTVIAPLYNYKGYIVKDMEGRQFDIKDDPYCRVSFVVPSGYFGTIRISFVEPWYWRLSEIISLIAWITLFVYMLSHRDKFAVYKRLRLPLH